MPDGDQGRWLSYQELGEALGCTANAARMHAVRRGWPRRAPNMIGGRATVLVPDVQDVRPRMTNSAALYDEHVQEGANNGAVHVQALSAAISALHEALTAERTRAERLEEKLGDAVSAERIARDEANGLRAELDARKQWGLCRRLRGR